MARVRVRVTCLNAAGLEVAEEPRAHGGGIKSPQEQTQLWGREEE